MTVSPPLIPSKRQLRAVGASVTELFPSAEGPLATPLGHLLTTLVDPLEFARERYARYGPMSWAGGVGFKVVAALGPDAMEAVWLNKDKAFSSTRGWAPVIGPFFQRGIMLLDFEEHRDHRRIMQQAFTRSRLDGYLQLMNPIIDSTLSGWRPRQRFPFYPSAKHLLLDLAAQVFVGVELGPESDQLTRDFNDTVRGGQAAIRANVPGGVWARGLQARKRLERFFLDLLPARKRGEGADLFSVLAQSETDDGLRFSDADIVNHMIFMLMAAHDTSAIALSMLTYELGRNPLWQGRLWRGGPTPPARPGVQGDPADVRAGRRPVPAGHQGHRNPRPLRSAQVADRAERPRLNAAPGLLAGSGHLRPQPIRGPGQSGRSAPIRLLPIRRRCPQVHRPVLRRDDGQDGPARDAEAVRVGRARRLPGAPDLGNRADARRRPAGHPGARSARVHLRSCAEGLFRP